MQPVHRWDLWSGIGCATELHRDLQAWEVGHCWGSQRDLQWRLRCRWECTTVLHYWFNLCFLQGVTEPGDRPDPAAMGLALPEKSVAVASLNAPFVGQVNFRTVWGSLNVRLARATNLLRERVSNFWPETPSATIARRVNGRASARPSARQIQRLASAPQLVEKSGWVFEV